jgi:hypothetical protein
VSCQILRAPGAVFSVWATPELDDIESIMKEVREASEAAAHPIVYITRVPSGAPPPEAPVRARLQATMDELVSMCSSYHVVLEGEGFGAALKRGVLLNLLQPFWRPRVFHVHATCQEVAKRLTETERATGTAMLDLAERRGLT